MYLSGTIITITDRFLRIRTYEKRQEIDVFYTEMNAAEVQKLIVGEDVKLDTKIQSVNVNGELMGKFWLWYIQSPSRKFEKKYKGKNTDWSKRHL